MSERARYKISMAGRRRRKVIIIKQQSANILTRHITNRIYTLERPGHKRRYIRIELCGSRARAYDGFIWRHRGQSWQKEGCWGLSPAHVSPVTQQPSLPAAVGVNLLLSSTARGCRRRHLKFRFATIKFMPTRPAIVHNYYLYPRAEQQP